ncbi:hypothetical protein K439DRAFT_1343386, partial [Ramaria rubella]
HDPIDVPDACSPFTHPDVLKTFKTALTYVHNAGLVPVDMGLRENEWEDSTYPTFEILKVGRTKDTIITLPCTIWLPRAIQFRQGLELMNRVMAIAMENEN